MLRARSGLQGDFQSCIAPPCADLGSFPGPQQPSSSRAGVGLVFRWVVPLAVTSHSPMRYWEARFPGLLCLEEKLYTRTIDLGVSGGLLSYRQS